MMSNEFRLLCQSCSHELVPGVVFEVDDDLLNMSNNVFCPEQAADCSSAFLGFSLFWCPVLFVRFIFKSNLYLHFTFILRSYAIFKY